MAKAKAKPKKPKLENLIAFTIHAHAAGIDIGATELVVAVPPEKDPESVRTFGTTTSDLRALGEWLLACGITSVAMESTGIYWVNPLLHLRSCGLEVLLVNAQHTKLCPARKTDIVDAQWLMQLHRAGLLTGSFHPPADVLALRDLMRERQSLVQDASRQLLRMQKVLISVNVQVHHIISDLDGVSGLRMVEAILAGEQAPAALWALRDKRCQTPTAQALKALEGNWTTAAVERLRRTYQTWQHHQSQITQLETELHTALQNLQARIDPRVEVAGPTQSESGAPPTNCKHYELKERRGAESAAALTKPNKPNKRFKKGEIAFDVKSEAHRIYGVDLSAIPGISTNVLATLLSEVGGAEVLLGNFRSAAAFSSWLGLCPDNRKSGGKVLSAKTRRVNSRLAAALRMSAQTMWRSQDAIGQWSRKMKGKLGKAEGITATAHLLARILYTMVLRQCAFDISKVFSPTQHQEAKKKARLQREAAALGYALKPVA